MKRLQNDFVLFAGSSTVSFGHTPTRRVLATALRPPLLISPTELKFTMQAGYLETTTEPTQHSQVCTWTIYMSPGHSQILSHSCRENSSFLHNCEIKSGSGLGTRLMHLHSSVNVPTYMYVPTLNVL